MPMRLRVCLAIVVSALLFPSLACAQQYIGAGVGVYSDDGDLDGAERRDVVRETDESFSFAAESTLAGGIWYLRRLSEHTRWGGGLRYYGSYEIRRVPDDDDGSDDIDPFELGELTNLYLQTEWLIPFDGNKAFILGGQAGPSVVFPDGELQDTIDELDDQGVGVWDVPRVGFNIAPRVGGRWELDDRLSVRADVGVRYEKLYLFAIDDKVDGVTYEKSWSTSTLRYELDVAMEIKL